MKQCSLLFTITVLFTAASHASAASKEDHTKVVVCYVGTWATYRPGNGKFVIESLQPKYCTHFVYAFAGLDNNTWSIKSLDPEYDITQGNYKRMTNYCKEDPKLKCSIAVGGWNEGSPNYSNLASSLEKRQAFIKSVLTFLKDYQFNGFDFDWEYPGSNGGTVNDKENFVYLLKELKEAFKPYKYLLTAAIGASKMIIDTGYDIPNITKYLDYVHVMTYDYYGAWNYRVLPNAPLRADNGVSVENSVKYLLESGAPRQKLVLGLPMYGRTFTMKNEIGPNDDPINRESEGPGFMGNYTKTNGFMGYNEICLTLKFEKDWRYGIDKGSKTPYIVNKKRVVVYDDPKSITEKINLTMDQKLAGVMVWSIDTDDFRGDCGEKFILMNAMNKALTKSSASALIITHSFVLLTLSVFYF